MRSPTSFETSNRTDGSAPELRQAMTRLVALYGTALATADEAMRACEQELGVFYRGASALRAYAVVQALKGGLVAELLGRPDATREIAAQLTEKSGVAPPIAQWAVDAWTAAFAETLAAARAAAEARRAPASATAQAASPATATPPAREMVLRLPHLLAIGALAALAIVLIAALGGPPLPRALRVFREAAASGPAMPPAPAPETR
jgi:hypothetical protein